MPKKGTTRTPDPVYEEVLSVIATMVDQDVFSPKDVQAKIPHRSKQQVSEAIYSQSRRGSLERVGHGRYRRGGLRIKTTLPHGLIAEAVWAVLFTAQKPMRLPEIVGEAESYINRPGVSIYYQVASVLCVWHRNGYLEQSGMRREHTYRLREGVTERPIYHR